MQNKFGRLKVMVVRHREDGIPRQKSDTFHKVSAKVANRMGSPVAFVLALFVIIVWGVTGPIFNFSDTWQLIINTGTTIVTFLMVFVIQNTQNRDGRAMQLKLDELIQATKTARTEFVDVESLTDAELDELQEEFKLVQEKIQSKKKK